MRKLKYHEEKLLKKANFYSYKNENQNELKTIRRYHVQDREDYQKYNKIVGKVTKLVAKLESLPSSDPYRIEKTSALTKYLYDMGLINKDGQGLRACTRVNVAAFCRRRLPVVMQRLKMAESVSDAVKYIEQGHVRVGVETITDGAFHVTRTMEDHVTWVKGGTIERKIKEYTEKRDDFDLL